MIHCESTLHLPAITLSKHFSVPRKVTIETGNFASFFIYTKIWFVPDHFELAERSQIIRDIIWL